MSDSILSADLPNTFSKTLGLDAAAILLIDSIKPFSYVGSQMSRLFVTPFLALEENIGITGEKILQIFEKPESVEKLIKAIEELSREEQKKKEQKRNQKS